MDQAGALFWSICELPDPVVTISVVRKSAPFRNLRPLLIKFDYASLLAMPTLEYSLFSTLGFGRT